jgi:hypothetical protein
LRYVLSEKSLNDEHTFLEVIFLFSIKSVFGIFISYLVEKMNFVSDNWAGLAMHDTISLFKFISLHSIGRFIIS